MYYTYHYLGEYPDSALSDVTVVLKRGDGYLFKDGKLLHGEMQLGKPAKYAAEQLLKQEYIEVYSLKEVNIYARKGNGAVTYGMLYLAEISEKDGGDFCDWICETERDDVHFLAYVKDYFQPKHETEELWDMYDTERNFTGKTHPRGVLIPNGMYHIVVHAWVQNADGRILLTQRSINKSYAEMWECSGGSAVAGEDSLTAAVREIEEETGILVKPEEGTLFRSIRRVNDFLDVWLFRTEIDFDAIKLQERETCGVRLVYPHELLEMKEQEELVPYVYLAELVACSEQNRSFSL